VCCASRMETNIESVPRSRKSGGCVTRPVLWQVPRRRCWTARHATSRHGTRRGPSVWLAPAQGSPTHDGRPSRRQWVDASAIETIFQEQEAIAQRLKASPTVQDFVRQTSRNPQANDIWSVSGHAAADPACYDFREQVPSLSLVWQAHTSGSWWPGFWAAVLIVAVSAGFYVLAVQGVLALWLQRWPGAVGVLAGILWWLLAWPSLLGWVIVAASLWVRSVCLSLLIVSLRASRTTPRIRLQAASSGRPGGNREC